MLHLASVIFKSSGPVVFLTHAKYIYMWRHSKQDSFLISGRPPANACI